MSQPSPKALLEQFVVDNQNLEHLESRLAQFNIFEAVGMVRQEIRHSRFLAFLLNPNGTHRLGDIFLKTFLKQLLIAADNATVSPIEIDIANLTDTQVRREWQNIDILLIAPDSQIVCAIENKVDSGEHSNQLQRYRNIILKEFPTYRHIFVFLTRDGIRPDSHHDQQHWSPYSYGQIAQLIDHISERYQSTIGTDIRTLMQHYSNLINRHFMQDSEIARLCRQIYAQHKDALDLIYEHRPDPKTEIFDYLKTLINETPSDHVILDHAWMTWNCVGFAIPHWDNLPFQKTCQGWSSSNRILLFEFIVTPPTLSLILLVGPGEDHTRQAIFNALNHKNIPGCVNRPSELSKKHALLIDRPILDSINLETSIQEIQPTIQQFWQSFLTEELPRIDTAITTAMAPSD